MTALPIGAPLVHEADGVAVYDISEHMPEPAKWSKHRRPKDATIDRVGVHNSGALGASGWKGPRNACRYVLESRGFGARPYHLWAPYAPGRDDEGRLVGYQIAPFSERAWHTGRKANDLGVGLCFQGYLSPGHDGEPTQAQLRVGRVMLDWVCDLFDIAPGMVAPHSMGKMIGASKNKATCPGPYIEAWLSDWIEHRKRPPPPPPRDPSAVLVPFIDAAMEATLRGDTGEATAQLRLLRWAVTQWAEEG